MKISIRNYEPLPTGVYHFRVTDCQVRNADKGDFLSWTLEVLDGQEAGNTMNYATPINFGPNSKAFKFLVAAGLNPAMDQGEIDTNDFVGRDLFGDVEVKATTGDRKKNEFKALWSVAEYYSKFGGYNPAPQTNYAPPPTQYAQAPAAAPVSQINYAPPRAAGNYPPPPVAGNVFPPQVQQPPQQVQQPPQQVVTGAAAGQVPPVPVPPAPVQPSNPPTGAANAPAGNLDFPQ